ncbi:hypothetical protein BGW41_004044 [Actinomortierella wolfii]|nr:hypothetical protein BGW41_004044 [Actinomortierella wolfii]
MHQSSLIIAIVACFVAALTVTVDASSTVIKHKYTGTAAFKPYFCGAFHTGCRRFCSYEYQYVNSTCKASKDKKYFTVACNCDDEYPDDGFTAGVLSHNKQTAQRTLKSYLDSTFNVTNFGNELKADCKATCKGFKTTAKFTVLPPKEPEQDGARYSFKCKCGSHYVNDLVDYWLRVHWDI